MRSRTSWVLVIAVSLVAILLSGSLLGWLGWAFSWIGTGFKAASGGALGWLVSRYVVKLDLSTIAEADARTVAALSQALLIGLFALAVATGA